MANTPCPPFPPCPLRAPACARAIGRAVPVPHRGVATAWGWDVDAGSYERQMGTQAGRRTPRGAMRRTGSGQGEEGIGMGDSGEHDMFIPANMRRLAGKCPSDVGAGGKSCDSAPIPSCLRFHAPADATQRRDDASDGIQVRIRIMLGDATCVPASPHPRCDAGAVTPVRPAVRTRMPAAHGVRRTDSLRTTATHGVTSRTQMVAWPATRRGTR